MYTMTGLLFFATTMMGSTGFIGSRTQFDTEQRGLEVADRDKTGTTACPKNSNGPQTPVNQALASRVFFQAEGMGLEPTTGFPAPHFQ